jgi:hypothetical protein
MKRRIRYHNIKPFSIDSDGYSVVEMTKRNCLPVVLPVIDYSVGRLSHKKRVQSPVLGKEDNATLIRPELPEGAARLTAENYPKRSLVHS